MSNVVIINGSPSPVSRLHGLTEYVEHQLKEHAINVEHIQVADLPAEDLIKARFDSEAILNANRKVAEADGVIIASPVYKAAYTGILKTYLDLLPQKGFAEKTIFPLFIGGTIAHLLSIDYALKPVLSTMGARHILGGVYAIDAWVVRDQNQYTLSDELLQRLDDSISEFVKAIKPKS